MKAEKRVAKDHRLYINLPDRRPGLPFSDGVLVGDTLYVAGRLGLDPVTGKPPADLEQEARIMLDGVKAVLREVGMHMADLVMVNIFCSDVALFQPFNEVYKTYFEEDLPARAFLGSGPLLFGARFEVTAIAVKT